MTRLSTPVHFPVDRRRRRRVFAAPLPAVGALYLPGIKEAGVEAVGPVIGGEDRPRQLMARKGGCFDIQCGSGRSSAPPAIWRGFVRFPADRIHKAVVEALVPGALVTDTGGTEGERTWERRYDFATRGSRDRLTGTLGFRVSPAQPSPADPECALLVKLQFALWSRYYVEPGAELPLRTNLSQLCDDLGYARLGNGAHRPATRRRVADLVRLLASLELDAWYRAPDGRSHHLAGAVWLFRECSVREIVYQPGDWFYHPAWKRFNHQVGLADQGFLGLRPDRDQWAIYVGGYLASLARLNGYRTLSLRVETLLQRSGLAWAERRNPARMQEKLARSLERLEEVGVLGGWDWDGDGETEPDMDSPEQLRALPKAAEVWRDRRLTCRWPTELEVRGQHLEAARGRHRRRDRPPNAVSESRRGPRH